MTDDAPLFSPYWYKVSGLSPRLRPGVTVTRRIEQGECWHILFATENNRHFRLDEASWAIVGACDGQHKLETIWRRVLDRFGDAAPGQDETIRLLGQLHQADALNAGTAPVLAEFGHRARRQARQRLLQKLKSPLFVKIPLFDPKRVIEATYPLARPVFSLPGFLLWCTLMVWLVTEAVANWQALSGAVLDRALAADNLLIAALVFPFAKAFHELAHGWAVRHWGGQVRETGIMFLVFLPAPYVDASEAASFRSRRARLVVGAAGMMAEAALAAGAMYVWLGAETGLVSAIAFNTMLIAGVSTFFFNGNPLLRFDAYFMLSDAIGVQNLAGRSQKWWGWLVHRFAFGLEGWENPARTRAESRWFALYHPASYAYRVFLTLSIALFVAQEYRLVGLTLAVWSVVTTLLLPAVQGGWHVLTAPGVAPRRGRALGATLGLVALPVLALTLIPLPWGTVAPAVVIPPEEARLSLPVEAEIAEVMAISGTRIRKGAAIARLQAPLAMSQLDLIEARLVATRARLAVFEAEPGRSDEAAAARAEIGYLMEERQERRADLAQLAVTAPADGRFMAESQVALPGRRLPEGRELGLLIPDTARARLRAAVPAARIDLVATAPQEVALYLPGVGFAPLTARLLTLAPEATRQVAFPALTRAAGGPIQMDPTDDTGRRAAQPFHVAEIATDLPFDALAVGGRVWVRFDHGRAPLAPRIWRVIRQTFLTRLAL